jgi:hypothetical protein
MEENCLPRILLKVEQYHFQNDRNAIPAFTARQISAQSLQDKLILCKRDFLYHNESAIFFQFFLLQAEINVSLMIREISAWIGSFTEVTDKADRSIGGDEAVLERKYFSFVL